MVLFDKEAGIPGNSIAVLKFQAQADDAALLEFSLQYLERKTSQASFTQDPE